MVKRTLLFLASIGLIGSPVPGTTASNQYTAVIGGKAMSCRSWTGQPVRIVSDTGLQTLGQAFSTADGRPIVAMNMAAVGAFSPKVQQWWFSHECAHHELPPQLNSERRADCIGMKRLTKKTGALNERDVQAFREELRFLPGSAQGHLPGAARANLVLKCAGASAGAATA